MTSLPVTIGALQSDDLGYRLLLLGHIVAVVVGFGSTFVWPRLGAEAGRRGGHEGAVLSQVTMDSAAVLTNPPIYVAGALGIALALAGDRMDEAWAGIATAVFVFGVAFAGFVHGPNLKRMNALVQELDAAGPPPPGTTGGPPPQVAEIQSRGKAAARNGGILHLVFLVLVVLMIWQPT